MQTTLVVWSQTMQTTLVQRAIVLQRVLQLELPTAQRLRDLEGGRRRRRRWRWAATARESRDAGESAYRHAPLLQVSRQQAFGVAVTELFNLGRSEELAADQTAPTAEVRRRVMARDGGVPIVEPMPVVTARRYPNTFGIE